jgi:hypothetical protein
MKFCRPFVLAALTIELLVSTATAATLYVDLQSGNPASPFASWATAAADIQSAVDAASPGDQILVTNGVYATGGRVANGLLTNRVAVTNLVTLQSVNGPAVTFIQGNQVPVTTNDDSAVRCVYLGGGASLIGFTLTNGATRKTDDGLGGAYGGGVLCQFGVVSNCVLTGNSAYSGGGGAFQGTLNNCTLISNWCYRGGGAGSSTLNGCNLTGNVAAFGGGADGGTLNNCVLTGNSALSGQGGGAYSARLYNCSLSGNSAVLGGGAYSGTLSNCVLAGNFGGNGGGASGANLTNCSLSGNSASYGGGAGGSVLNNCALTGNFATNSGGGAYGGTLTNCMVNSNSAVSGGGAAYGTLNNCVLMSNFTITIHIDFPPGYRNGGGAEQSTLNNCTLVGNQALDYGGGADGGSLNNCISYYNAAPLGGNNYYPATNTLLYCCTVPLPAIGTNNFTNAPLFVDQAGGNLRLLSNSPCINAGKNALAPPRPDLDGNPRIVGGTVDVGAYEFQSPVSLISYAWLLQHGLPIDGSVDSADLDGDGCSNWQEWRAGTDPTNAASCLRVQPPAPGPAGIVITWPSVGGVAYYLERSTDLTAQPSFQTIATNLPGLAGTTSFTDTNATGPGPWFYRVGVR